MQSSRFQLFHILLHPFTYFHQSLKTISDDPGYRFESISRRFAANLDPFKRKTLNMLIASYSSSRWSLTRTYKATSFCADNYRVVCWWVSGASQSHTSTANLWPRPMSGSRTKSAQSRLWCLCVVEEQGGARDNLTSSGGERPLNDLLIGLLQSLMRCCVSVLQTIKDLTFTFYPFMSWGSWILYSAYAFHVQFNNFSKC